MAALGAIIAACSVTPAPPVFVTPPPPPPTPNADRVAIVTAYLTALEQGDAGAIKALLHPNVDPAGTIAVVLGTYGGLSFGNARINWRYDQDQPDGYDIAIVTGTGADGEPYKVVVPTYREGDGYYLVILASPPPGY